MGRIGNEKVGNQLLIVPAAVGSLLRENRIAVLNPQGYAEEAAQTAGQKVIGRIQEPCDNRNGQNGERQVVVKRGTFLWEQDGTIKNTDILKKCYITDAVTVSLEETGSSVAGTILGIEESYVVVDMTAL